MSQIKVVALDDGHGMSTAGKRTPVFLDGTKSPETGKNFMHENEFNRAVVKYLKVHLERNGFKVILVAPTDADTPLADRVELAKKIGADIYLSVHANAAAGTWGTWGGIETFVWPSGEGKRVGTIIHKHLLGGTDLRNRGIKDGSHLYVIRKTNMPAILFELGFMDNLYEAKLLLSDAYRRECALEIAQGLCEATNKKYIADTSNKKEEKIVNLTSAQMRMLDRLEGHGIIAKGFKPSSNEQVVMLETINHTIDAMVNILRGEDTKPSPWAVEDIQKAMDAKITDGSRPMGYATRQDLMVMLGRYAASQKEVGLLTKDDIQKMINDAVKNLDIVSK